MTAGEACLQKTAPRAAAELPSKTGRRAITHVTRPAAPRCSAQPPVAPANPPCPRQQCVVQETP